MNLLSVLWGIAFGICPQRPSHSLFFGGQQMPIEARMAGIFGGFLIGLTYFVGTGRGRAWRMPSNTMTVILIGFVALMGVDGVNALLFDLHLPHLYAPNLMLRLGTGLFTGLAIAGLMLPAFNSTVWRTGLNTAPISGARDLLAGFALGAVYFVAAFSGADFLLYPVSLIAVIGVPVLLVMTNATILAMALGRMNRAERMMDLLPLLTGGLVAATLMLGVMGGGRYLVFGTGPLELPMR